MKLLNQIKDFFREKEAIEVSIEEADTLFRDLREDKIEESRERKKELKKKSERIISDIKDSLEEIKDFEDDEDLDVVEDVARSFYNSRKNLLENLDLPEDIETHSQRFNEFIDDFNDVSMKEGAVMKRIHSKSGELGGLIEEAVDHGDKLENFVEKDFKPVLKLREIQKNKENLVEARKDIEELKERLDSIETANLEEKISRKKDELNEIETSEALQRLERLKSQRDNLEQKKDDKRKKIERKISSIERGLKKGLYQIENTESTFSGSKSELEKLLNHEFMNNPYIGENLPEIADLLEKKDVLSDRQLEKFRNGIGKLENLGKQVQEIKVLEEEIEELEEKIEDSNVIERKKEVEKEVKDLKEQLKERESEISEIESRIRDSQDDLDDGVAELESRLEAELGRDISIRVESE